MQSWHGDGIHLNDQGIELETLAPPITRGTNSALNLFSTGSLHCVVAKQLQLENNASSVAGHAISQKL